MPLAANSQQARSGSVGAHGSITGAVTRWSGFRRLFASSALARRSVRRAFILVLVAAVSGLAAYIVNAGNGTRPARAVALQGASPDRPAGFARFAGCLSRYGVRLPRPGEPRVGFDGDVRAAFAACRQYLPAPQSGRRPLRSALSARKGRARRESRSPAAS